MQAMPTASPPARRPRLRGSPPPPSRRRRRSPSRRRPPARSRSSAPCTAPKRPGPSPSARSCRAAQGCVAAGRQLRRRRPARADSTCARRPMPIHWKGNAMTLRPVDSAQGAQRLSTPEANALVISLLGGFQARVGASTIHLPTRKTQALLAYLALHPGHPHDREKIQGLLWPDAPPRQAQASLRQTLFTLRKTLPGTSAAALLTTATTVALDASHLTVDVAILERHVGGVTREALEGVASLYAGHLLEAFVIDEAPFDRWIENERSRLREVALGTLERLLDLQAAAGEPEKAIQTALHSLRLDPLRESTHRALMQLYAASGRRGAAVQQYRSLVSALAQELGVEPDSQTKRLHDDILRLDSAGVAPTPGSSPRRPSADGPRSGPAPTALRHLIGRDAEMARIHQALDDAWSGTGKLSLLSGDTGVGKTRILEEVATRALGRGG